MTAVREFPLRDAYIDHWLWSLSPDNAEERWRYARCPEDHVLTLVDAEACGCRSVRAAAMTSLHTAMGGAAVLRLSGLGIDRVFVNGELIGQEMVADAQTIPVLLHPGRTEIRIDFRIPAGRGAVTMRAAARVCDAPPDTMVQILTTSGDPARWAKFERVFDGAIIDRDVYTAGALVQLTWPSLDERCTTQGRLQHSSGRIYGQSTKMLDAETRTLVLGKAINIPDGAYQIVVMPDSGTSIMGGLATADPCPSTSARPPSRRPGMRIWSPARRGSGTRRRFQRQSCRPDCSDGAWTVV
ncbi:MAG: hypothetical protein IPK19_07190 [Chloroflexi bacterium]|nr:hypothetical protein [Chloroflexota bacterium]